MSSVFLTLGVFSLLYLLVLLAKRVDFAIIWLPIGGLLLALGLYIRYRTAHPEGFRLPAALEGAVCILLTAGLAAFLFVEGQILWEMLTKPRPDLDVVIVLGAQVKGQSPSKALRLRLETAFDYLSENPDTVAVLSGGQGDGEEITEAQCMWNYLTAHGIAGERLLLEEHSTSTEENLRFSSKMIAAWQRRRIGLLSNNFHLYRALCLARGMGYENISGIPARSDWHLQLHYLVREFFALAKEKAAGYI